MTVKQPNIEQCETGRINFIEQVHREHLDDQFKFISCVNSREVPELMDKYLPKPKELQ